MPTYDYACGACGAELEIFHSMTESAKRKCPECGALKLARRIGAGAGILFKGKGFYQTDYRSKSYEEGKKAAEKASSESKSEAPKADAKSPPGDGNKGKGDKKG